MVARDITKILCHNFDSWNYEQYISYLEVIRQLLSACVARVHRDKHGAGGVEGQLCTLKDEAFQAGIDSVLNGRDLLRHDGQDFEFDAVEFVEARPRSGLRETLEELTHSLEVKAVGTVEDDALKGRSK